MLKIVTLIYSILSIYVLQIENCRPTITVYTSAPTTTKVIQSIKKCPSPEPISNFNLSKVLGTWYNYVASSSIVQSGERCTKLEFSQSQPNEVLFKITLLIDGNQNPMTESYTQIVNAAVPGTFNQTTTLPVLDSNGNTVETVMPFTIRVLYADDKYVLRYACGEYTNYTSSEILEYFFLAKRSRASNALAEAWPILSLVKDLPTNLNSGVYIPNDGTCNI